MVVERLDFTQHGTGVALKNVSDWNYSDATVRYEAHAMIAAYGHQEQA